MEFGTYNDYIPDYSILINLHPFFIFDPCEENYKHVSFITEIGSFLTSFPLFLPYIFMRYFMKKESYCPETLQIAKQFFYCGFASLGYHGYVSFVTQFMDMLTIIWAIMSIINLLKIPFTPKQEYYCIILYFFGLIHPLFTAFSMLYLIFKCAAFLLRFSLSKNRYNALIPVFLILLSFFLIFLDIVLCPYKVFRYFHCIWHLTAFGSFSFMLIEVDLFIKYQKRILTNS